MERRIAIVPLLVLLLASSCERHREYVFKGTLHSDSTLSTPLSGDTLTFSEGAYYDILDGYEDARFLGQAVADSRGRWAFQYVTNIDNPHQQQASKFQMDDGLDAVLITHGDDTLFCGSPRHKATLKLYPGCWQNPHWRPAPQPPAPTPAAADSNRTEGGRP